MRDSNSKNIDYRTMLGSRRSIHGRRLTKCPKCGKLGEVHTHKTKRGRTVYAVTHAGRLIEVCGLPMFEVEVHCSIYADEVEK